MEKNHTNTDSSSILEANAAGKLFEQHICKNVNSKLLINFKNIEAYTSSEIFDNNLISLDGREEDYSDICILNKKTNNKVFIECKESLNSNIANLKFVINDDNSISFVSGKSKQLIESDLAKRLATDIQNSESYSIFVKFMNAKNELLKGFSPADYYFGRKQPNAELVAFLANKVNAKKDIFNTTAKEIPIGKFVDSTLGTWILALTWKLADENENHIYDFCSIDINYMSQLVLDHYKNQKKEQAAYCQINDDLYIFNKAKNPLKLQLDNDNITTFPEQLNGTYTLKFTPRLSKPNNLKIYLDTRTNFLKELPKSNCSLKNIDSTRFPKIKQTKSK